MSESKQVTNSINVPNTWRLVAISDILTLGGGKDYKHLNKGDIPVYGTGGYMTSVDDFLYDGESVGIGRKGTIDKPVFLQGKFWTVDTLFYTHSFKNVIPYFVYLVFQSINWRKFSEATGVPSLSKNIIEPIKVLLPPLPEQQKIAEILSTVDAKIEVIDQQITETQALKKGLMQRLLTKGIGHTEFRDSPLGDIPKCWEVLKLEEIGNFFKGKGISKSEILKKGQFPCLRYGEIYTIYDTVIYNFQSFINEESANNSIAFKSGDLLFTGSGETAEDIGKCVTYIGSETPYASGDLIIHRPIKGDSRFLSYCMNSSIIRNQTKKMGQGNAVVHIYTKHLSQLTFAFPPFEEQTQIAEILSSVDDKLNILSEKKTHYQELKQGLMQQLLTGKIRVHFD